MTQQEAVEIFKLIKAEYDSLKDDHPTSAYLVS